MTTPKISRPKVRVVVERDGGELVQYDVQTDNRDAVRFDLTRARKGWPDGETAPMLWLAYCAWSALRRSGELDKAVDADRFLADVCVDVAVLDDETGEPIDPQKIMRQLAAGEDVSTGQAAPFPDEE